MSINTPRAARWIVAAFAFFATAALTPAVASATTARVDGGVIVVEDTQGISDDITVSSAGSNESGPTIRIDGATPGTGCTPDAQGDAFCPDGTGATGTGTPHSMRFALGGGDDEVTLSRTINSGLDAVDVTFDTGAGEDEVDVGTARGRFLIATGSEDDLVHFSGGGSGTQEPATVDTAAGNDKVELAGNLNVGDTVDGGAGTADHLSYFGRSAAVTVVSDPTQSSGRTGENDHLSNFETLEGGSGADTVIGGAGNETLIGGGGAGDILRGNGGNDTLNTNDGLKDARAECGLDGADIAIIDSVDPHPNVTGGPTFFRPINGGNRNCETVMQQPLGKPPLARLSRVRATDDTVTVRLSCESRGGCEGTLLVIDERIRTLSERERFDLDKGDSETFRLDLKVKNLPDEARVLAEGRDRKGRRLESSVAVP